MKFIAAIFTIAFSAMTLNAQDVRWGFSVGGADEDIAYGISYDSIGNTIVTGTFKATADFQRSTGSHTLTSSNPSAFLCKYSPTGDLIWGYDITEGAVNGYGKSVAVDDTGNIYVTGYYQGTADFDPSSGTDIFTSIGDDAFLAKYSSNGNLLWVKSFEEEGFDVKLGVDGTLYYTGKNGNYGVVTRYNPSGLQLWSASLYRGNNTNLEIDSQGNVFVVGSFFGTSDFDPGTGTNDITSNGGTDAFVWKLDSSGNYVWAVAMGGTSSDHGVGIALDASGNIYVAGDFEGTADFDPGAGTVNRTSRAASDGFVTKLSPTGILHWVAQYRGFLDVEPKRISINAQGDVVIVGEYSNICDFDPGTGSAALASTGFSDVFVSTLDNQGSFVSIGEIRSTSSVRLYDFLIDDKEDYLFAGGIFASTDVHPGTQVYGVSTQTSTFGYLDGLIVRYAQCDHTESTLIIDACKEYVSPSGQLLTQSGNYQEVLPYANSAGCDSIINIRLNLRDFNKFIYRNDSALVSLENNAMNYQWIYCDSVIIPGATSKTYVPTMNGSYAVVLSDSSCVDTSNCYSIADIGLQANASIIYSLYPSPASDNLTIELSVQGAEMRLEIFDSHGRLCIEKELYGSGRHVIPFQLTSGLYIVRITDKTNAKVEIEKLVIIAE
ncbi:MAG: T9SS type A sorting domain-containing protein [Flavobacteriia bacterium]|nr:T9SS type A sorting domain-containing protein [Flavobacteriia bacterium]